MTLNKKLSIKLENVNLVDAIEDVIDNLEMKADVRKIKLLAEYDPRLPQYYCTDPKRLKQILINLVANAIKYTFEGYVKITASVLNHDKTRVRISVEDTGIGIE